MKVITAGLLALFGFLLLPQAAQATNPTATVTCTEFQFSVNDAYADTTVTFVVDGVTYSYAAAPADEAGNWPRSINQTVPFAGQPHDVIVTIGLPAAQYPYDPTRTITAVAPTDCVPATTVAPVTTLPAPTTTVPVTTLPVPVTTLAPAATTVAPATTEPAQATTVVPSTTVAPTTTAAVVTTEVAQSTTTTVVAKASSTSTVRVLPETGNSAQATIATLLIAAGLCAVGYAIIHASRRPRM
jgi:hypothetical protein